jgi:YkgG family uncharacterized protein
MTSTAAVLNEPEARSRDASRTRESVAICPARKSHAYRLAAATGHWQMRTRPAGFTLKGMTAHEITTIHAPDRFTTLPDDPTLAATVLALEEHGFSVDVVDDFDAARDAVLARIPAGSSVMTNTSVTLEETGIAETINNGGPYESARNKLMALDFATQLQEMKAIGGQPDFALGSVHAVTREGTLVIASASGSQLASYAWGAQTSSSSSARRSSSPAWKRHTSGSTSTA